MEQPHSFVLFTEPMRLLALIDFAAAVQGILLAYFLLRRHGRSLQHRLLALFVITMSIVLLGAVLGLSGYYRIWPHLIRIADPFVLLFGPLLYFHVHVATRGHLPRRAIVHFIPFVAYVLFIVPFYALPAADKVALVEQVMGMRLAPPLATLLVIRTTHMLLYSILSLILVRRFQRGLRDQYSNVNERDLHRSVWFLLGYMGITLGLMVIIVVGTFLRIDIISANGVFGLLLGTCVYALADVSWPHPINRDVQVATARSAAGSPSPEVSLAPSVPVTANAPVERPRRNVHYLSDQQFAALAQRMVETLETEKAYLDGDLTLAQLSERVNAPAHQVSEVISRHYRSNFFDAVNRLRVEEVKRRLGDPAYATYSIPGISMDAGFNSKSSFNTAFRKHAGTTPSQFRLN